MKEQQKYMLRQVVLMRMNELRIMVNKLALAESQKAIEAEIDELAAILKLI